VSTRKESGRKSGEEPRREKSVGSKQKYQTPRLAVYGSLRRLALGVGGAKGDGAGNPRSRA
jgi:hypothetical protein